MAFDIVMGIFFDNCTYIVLVCIQLAGSLFPCFPAGRCLQILPYCPFCNTQYLRNFFLPFTVCLHNFCIHDFLLLVHYGVSLVDGFLSHPIFEADPFLLYKKRKFYFGVFRQFYISDNNKPLLRYLPKYNMQ